MPELYKLADALSGPISDPLGGRFSSLSNVIGFALNVLLGIGWALVFYNLALGFTGIALAGNKPDDAKKNQQKVMYAIVGGVMLFFISFLKSYLPTLIGGGGFSVNTITDF